MPQFPVRFAMQERSLQEWFEEAARCYAEQHQACCWCGRVHGVYRSERGGRLEYECGECEFWVCQATETGQYFMAPGNSRRATPARPTMHAV